MTNKLANKVDINDENVVDGTRLTSLSDSTFIFDDVVSVVDTDDDEGSRVSFSMNLNKYTYEDYLTEAFRLYILI